MTVPRRHRPPAPARDDGGADGSGMRRAAIDADLLEEGERLGATGEHGLRADVDEGPSDLLETQLATDPVTGLVEGHRDVGTEPRQLPGRRQTGDTSTDDGDLPVHAPTVSLASGHVRSGGRWGKTMT